MTDLAFAIRGVNATGGAFAAVRADVERTSAAFSKLSGVTGAFKSILSGIGIGVGFGALSAISQLPKIIGDTVDKASDLVHVADRIGLTTDRLQELHHAAQLADVDLGAFDQGMQIFTRSIGQALTGTGDLAKILKANGVALRDNAGNVKSAGELLDVYADLIRNARSEEERLFLARAAFGRGGDQFVTVLEQGSKGLRTAAKEAHDLGAVLGADLLRQAEKVGDDWTRFTTSLTVSFQSFVLSVVGGVAAVAGAINDLGKVQAMPPGAKPNASGFLSVVPGRSSPTDPRFSSGGDRSFTRYTSGLAGADYSVTPLGPAATYSRFTSGLAGADFKPTVLPPTPADTSAADKIKAVSDALKFQGEQLTRTAREQFIYNELQRSGAAANSAAGAEIMKAAGALYDQQQALDRTISLLDDMRDVAKSVFSTFVSDIRQGKTLLESLGDAVDRIADKLMDAGIDRLVTSLLGAGGTAGTGSIGGGLMSALGSLFGFADGGEFTIGGSGGTDSRVVAFRGTPGEKVKVTKPGQGGGEGMSGHLVIELRSELLDARMVRVASGVSVEVYRQGQKMGARQEELAG